VMEAHHQENFRQEFIYPTARKKWTRNFQQLQVYVIMLPCSGTQYKIVPPAMLQLISGQRDEVQWQFKIQKLSVTPVMLGKNFRTCKFIQLQDM